MPDDVAAPDIEAKSQEVLTRLGYAPKPAASAAPVDIAAKSQEVLAQMGYAPKPAPAVIPKAPQDFTDKYNTPLRPEQEAKFQAWAKTAKNALGSPVTNDLKDYDVRGRWQELEAMDPKSRVEATAPGAHGPDTWKKPSHITFSTDSKYHGVDGHEGGTWGKDEQGKDTFTPGATNLQIHGPEALQKYFKESEPGLKLLPGKGQEITGPMKDYITPGGMPQEELINRTIHNIAAPFLSEMSGIGKLAKDVEEHLGVVGKGVVQGLTGGLVGPVYVAARVQGFVGDKLSDWLKEQLPTTQKQYPGAGYEAIDWASKIAGGLLPYVATGGVMKAAGMKAASFMGKVLIDTAMFASVDIPRGYQEAGLAGALHAAWHSPITAMLFAVGGELPGEVGRTIGTGAAMAGSAVVGGERDPKKIAESFFTGVLLHNIMRGGEAAEAIANKSQRAYQDWINKNKITPGEIEGARNELRKVMPEDGNIAPEVKAAMDRQARQAALTKEASTKYLKNKEAEDKYFEGVAAEVGPERAQQLRDLRAATAPARARAYPLLAPSPVAPGPMASISAENIAGQMEAAWKGWEKPKAVDPVATKPMGAPGGAPVDEVNASKIVKAPKAPPKEIKTGRDIFKEVIALGDKHEVQTAQGTRIRTQFALVPRSRVINSQLTYPDNNPNPQFDQDYQPRDKTTKQAQLRIQQMRQNYNPAANGKSVWASEGPPVVKQDAHNLSGNSRQRLQEQIQAESGDPDPAVGGTWDELQDWNRSNLQAQYGIDPAYLSKAPDPMVIQIMLDEPSSREELIRLTREMNESSVSKRTAIEDAVADGKDLVAGNILSQYKPQYKIESEQNSDFVKAFIDRIVGYAEADSYYTVAKRGQGQSILNEAGLRRIKNAVFAAAYGKSGPLETLSTSTDDPAKNVTKALMNVAPRVAVHNQDIKTGDMFDLSISENLKDAADILVYMRNNKNNVPAEMTPLQYYQRQQSFFPDEPITIDLVKMLQKYTGSAKKLTAILDNYLDAVEELGSPKQAVDLMGGRTVVPEKTELLRIATEEMEAQDAERKLQAAKPPGRAATGGAGLLASSPVQPEGTPAGPPGTGGVAEETAPLNLEEPLGRQLGFDFSVPFFEAPEVKGRFADGSATPQDVAASLKAILGQEGGDLPAAGGTHRISERSPVGRALLSHGKVDLATLRLRPGEEAHDLADIFQVFRSPKAESLHIVYTDADGYIVGASAYSSGAINYVSTKKPPRFNAELRSQMERLGAAQVHLLHNHPSGTVTFSTADVDLFHSIRAALGDKAGQFVVIDHGKFSSLRPVEPGPASLSVRTGYQGIVGYYTPLNDVPNWLADRKIQINSVNALAEFTSGLKYDRDNTLVAVHTSASGQITAWEPLHIRLLEKPIADSKGPGQIIPGVRSILQQRMKANNSTQVALIVNEAARDKALAFLHKQTMEHMRGRVSAKDHFDSWLMELMVGQKSLRSEYGTLWEWPKTEEEGSPGTRLWEETKEYDKDRGIEAFMGKFGHRGEKPEGLLTGPQGAGGAPRGAAFGLEGQERPVSKFEAKEAVQGDTVTFTPKSKIRSAVTGIIQDEVASSTGAKGWNIRDESGDVHRVWEKDGQITLLTGAPGEAGADPSAWWDGLSPKEKNAVFYEEYGQKKIPSAYQGAFADLGKNEQEEIQALHELRQEGRAKGAAFGLTAKAPPVSRFEQRLNQLQSEFPDIDQDKAIMVLRTFPDADNNQIANMTADPEMYSKVLKSSIETLERQRAAKGKEGTQQELFKSAATLFDTGGPNFVTALPGSFTADKQMSVFRNPDQDDLRRILRDSNAFDRRSDSWQDYQDDTTGYPQDIYKSGGARFIEVGGERYLFSDELIHSQVLARLNKMGIVKPGDKVEFGGTSIFKGKDGIIEAQDSYRDSGVVGDSTRGRYGREYLDIIDKGGGTIGEKPAETLQEFMGPAVVRETVAPYSAEDVPGKEDKAEVRQKWVEEAEDLIKRGETPSRRQFEGVLDKDDFAYYRRLIKPGNREIPLYQGEQFTSRAGDQIIEKPGAKPRKLSKDEIYERMFAPKRPLQQPEGTWAVGRDPLSVPEGVMEAPPAGKPGRLAAVKRVLQDNLSVQSISKLSAWAHQAVIEHMGWGAWEMSKQATVLDKYAPLFKGQPPEELHAFEEQKLDQYFDGLIEKGQMTPEGKAARMAKLDAVVAAWRNLSDGAHFAIAYEKDDDFPYWTDYFPRNFENPVMSQGVISEALAAQGRRGGGAASFEKARTRLTLAESIKPKLVIQPNAEGGFDVMKLDRYDGKPPEVAGTFDNEDAAKQMVTEQGGLGLRLIDPNYINVMKSNLWEKTRWLQDTYIKNDFEAAGLVQKGNQKGFKPVPDGWLPVPDRGIWKGYFAHPDVASVIDKHLSPGIRNSPLFKLYYEPFSFMNEVFVGFSGYHGMFSTLSYLSQGIGMNLPRAIGAAIRGDTKAMKLHISNLGKTFNLKGSWQEASRLAGEYQAPGTNPQMAEMSYLYRLGGGRVALESFGQFSQAFKDSIAESKINLLPGIVHAFSGPIMKQIVPHFKMMAFMRRMDNELFYANREAVKRGTPLSRDEIRELAQKVSFEQDKIYGQMIYDNLGMKRGMKDMLGLWIGFPGWNLGSFGVIKDALGGLAHLSGESIRAGVESFTGRTDPWKSLSVEQRSGMEFFAGMSLVMAVGGAILQRLLAGEWPKDGKDLFMPRTGATLPSGEAERVRMPTYLRDVLSLNHPIEMVAHKMAFPFRLAGELVRNQDYFGTEIRDPWAGAGEQAKQLAKWGGQSVLPFGIQGLIKTEDPRAKYLNLLGITKVPRAYTNSPAANVIDQYNQLMRPSTTTRETAEAKELKGNLMKMARAQDEAGFQDMATEAVSKGKLTRAQVKEIAEESQVPPGQTRFYRLPIEWMVRAMDQASDYERQQWTPLMLTKIDNTAKTKPEMLIRNKDALVPILKELGLNELAETVGEMQMPPEPLAGMDLTGLGIKREEDQDRSAEIEEAINRDIEKNLAKVGMPAKRRKSDRLRAFGLGA